MALTDNKITTWTNPIVNEADRPQRSASDMKAIFDSNSNQLKDALNALIEALAVGGAADIGITVDGLSGKTVSDIIAELKGITDDIDSAVDNLVATVLPKGDGSTFLANDGTWKLPAVGASANGLKPGGKAGDVYVKKSDTVYDGEWKSPEELGFGDMATSTYDTNQDGSVDEADYAEAAGNTELFGGKPITAFAAAPILRTATLGVALWTGAEAPFSQTITVTGVVADVNKQAIWPTPQPGYMAAWGAAGIECTAQDTDSLTFTCESAPENDIPILIVIVEAAKEATT